MSNRSKEKLKYAFLSVTPSIYCILIQLVTGLVLGQIFGNLYSTEWIKEHVAVVLLIIHSLLAVIFGTWYGHICRREPDAGLREAVNVNSILHIILLTFGLQTVTRSIFLMVDLLDPSAMENYGKLIEATGLVQGSVPALVASVILAPIGEECIFRGLTIRFLEKTGLRFWAVNLIQACAFGIMHGNIVQGLYAFALGLALGYTAYKYKSIIICILLHLIFNVFGSLVFPYLAAKGTASVMIWFIIGILAIASVIMLNIKSETLARPEAVKLKPTVFSCYKAYTHVLYRAIVHVAFPVFLTCIGALAFIPEETRGSLSASVVSMFLLVELIGDFAAFGAVSKKDTPINWIMSSCKGKSLIISVYRWDTAIKLIKYTICFAVMGLFPILKGDAANMLISYLTLILISFISSNFIKRIEFASMTVLITIPSMAAATLIIKFLPISGGFVIPGTVLLACLALAAIIVSYRINVHAYEQSYYQ